MSAAPANAVTLPHRWEWLIGWFRWYVRRFVRKNFHAVRLSKTSAPWPTADTPLVVVMNHPSWWDPMLAVLLTDAFPGFEHYGAIDAEAVKKYRVFEKLGFFAVDQHSLRGAAHFLRTAELVLSAPNRAVWLTVQGRFSDVRCRPLDLRSGVGHLAARLDNAVILPIALEYAFWNEKTPEALVRVGTPIAVADFPGLKAKEWTARIEAALTATLDTLNRETVARDPELFTPLMTGKVGVGGIYDAGRRVAATVRGRRFDPSHGEELTKGAAQ